MPSTFTTTLSIPFLLLTILFTTSHAELSHPTTSLLLPLTHSRTTSSSSSSSQMASQKLQGLKQLEVTDMLEPLRGFSEGYLITLNLGTPSQPIQVYMDTGSDLTWVPCGNPIFDCMDCGDSYRNYKFLSSFSPSHSSSSLRDLCTTASCTAIHSSDNSYDPCAASGCPLAAILRGVCPRPCPPFSYTYGGGGVVVGSLARDVLRVHGGVHGFSFGCVGSTYRDPIGIAGFGRGALSLPSQLGILHKGFSRCFLGFKFSNNPNMSSTLILGELAISPKEKLQFTTMLTTPIYPSSYYIGLEAISIDHNNNITTIAAPPQLRSFDLDGNGGTLIDSGTTYTHLPEPFYSQILSELQSKITYLRSVEHEARTGFDLCYKVPVNSDDDLPTVTFHFLNNVDVVLQKESCFYAMAAPSNNTVVKCLLFQRMEDGEYGPCAVFGSFQQQNMEVVYDLEKERVGFQPMDCASYAADHGLN